MNKDDKEDPDAQDEYDDEGNLVQRRGMISREQQEEAVREDENLKRNRAKLGKRF